MTKQEAMAQKTIKQKESQLESLTYSLTKTQDTLAEAHTAIDQYTARIEGLEGELKKNQRAQKSLQKQYDQLSGLSDAREVQRIETAEERDRVRDEMRHLEAEWDKVRHVELPQALEQKVRALRDMQRLQAEVDMLRKQLF